MTSRTWMTAAGVILLGLGLTGLFVVYAADIEYGVGTLVERAPLPVIASAGSDTLEDPEERPLGSMGRVQLERVGVDVAIIGGSDGLRDRALADGAWWHAGTAEPDANTGNTVLAGHRVRRVFAKLAYARIGDVIVLDWGAERHRYRVVRTFTVDPADTSILAQDGEKRLTLYTCLPRVFGNKRRVVVATPAE